MANLKFKQLLVLSNSAKSANLFEFQEDYNLVTAKENSVGKSTIVKLLFWCLGCEPIFDTNWNNLDCRAVVRFKIDDLEYEVSRYKDLISLKQPNQSHQKFTKITGEYSKVIAEIFGFKALLPNRKTGELETPPPSYYFLPFYIDQVRSWAAAWNNFDKLQQYDNWKATIIKYHVGLLTPSHFELDSKNNEKKVIAKEIEKLSYAISIVEDHIPEITNVTVNVALFDSMAEEIQKDLKKLSIQQEFFLEEATLLETEITYLTQQKIISEKIIGELDLDYKFSVEHIDNGDFECPLCGTVHDNSVISRTSILTDKVQAENQLDTLQKELEKLNQKFNANKNELGKVRNSIDEINSKYSLPDEKGENISMNSIIQNIAGNSIKRSVLENKKTKLDAENVLYNQIKQIRKDLKSDLTKEDIEKITSTFIQTFSDYIRILNAEAINLSLIKSPLDFNKIIKEGGAAEGSRAILAYYLTIFSMVESYGHEVKAPLVIDTPNQQEQSLSNYSQIIDLITNKISKNSQVILCGMENSLLKPYADKAKVIELNEKKLLDTSKYQEIKKVFDEIED